MCRVFAAPTSFYYATPPATRECDYYLLSVAAPALIKYVPRGCTTDRPSLLPIRSTSIPGTHYSCIFPPVSSVLGMGWVSPKLDVIWIWNNLQATREKQVFIIQGTCTTRLLGSSVAEFINQKNRYWLLACLEHNMSIFQRDSDKRYIYLRIFQRRRWVYDDKTRSTALWAAVERYRLLYRGGGAAVVVVALTRTTLIQHRFPQQRSDSGRWAFQLGPTNERARMRPRIVQEHHEWMNDRVDCGLQPFFVSFRRCCPRDRPCPHCLSGWVLFILEIVSDALKGLGHPIHPSIHPVKSATTLESPWDVFSKDTDGGEEGISTSSLSFRRQRKNANKWQRRGRRRKIKTLCVK